MKDYIYIITNDKKVPYMTLIHTILLIYINQGSIRVHISLINKVDL